MDSQQLAGKIALVTGGGSGIGRASALAMAREGARVGVLDVIGERATAVREEIQSAGGEAIALAADISKPNEIRLAIDELVSVYGGLHIVFANAGVNGVWAPIEEISDEEFRHIVDVNLGGTFYTVKYATPHLKAHGGVVVMTSSVNGTRNFSNAGASCYSSSKAAQVALAKMLAVELGAFGIRVNAICPGYVPSNIHAGTISRNRHKISIPVEFPEGSSPMKTHVTAEQVADLVLFLVSDRAKLITGEVVFIDAGSSLVIG